MSQDLSSEVILCPGCGQQFRRTAAQGLCPRCLASVAFGAKISSPPELPDPLGIVRQFGNYELLEEISRGGMGVVYRARQSNLDREVAIKVMLHGALASVDDVERFRTEAAVAARLKHPAIVAIHDIGEYEGQHYFSMDLIEGRDLSRLTHAGPLPASHAAQVLVQVADAIQHAHNQGVLHRDLKPSNIILDSDGRPHVTDFGLARRTGAGVSLTEPGQILGTPGYMSPEQAAGKKDIGPSTDLYSLGALLYHLLTGRAPFTGDTPTAVLRQVEERAPIAPRALNPATPVDLETICLKCLSKEPARRYPSAGALSADLGRFLRNEPIQARPNGMIEDAWRWCRRRPALAAALGGICLLLVAIATTSSLAAHRIDILHREASTNLYAADMRLAEQAVAESKFGVAVDLLDRHHPRSREPDLRGFEWYYLWDQCRSDEVATLGNQSNQVQRAAFSPDGRFAATGATDLAIWDIAQRHLVCHFAHPAFIWSLGFSPDSHRIAATFQDIALACYDLVEQKEINVITNAGISPLVLCWEPDNRHISTFCSGDSYSWDTLTAKITQTHLAQEPFGRVALSRNGRLAVGITPTWRLKIWEPATDTRVGEISLPVAVRSVAISPDGRLVVTGDFAGLLSVRDTGALDRTKVVDAHRGMLAVIMFSPDGKLAATGGADQLIRIWDAATWKCIGRLRGHRSVVFAIAFSPDNHWLISGDKTGDVKLWDLNTLKGVDDPGSGSTEAVISADGAHLGLLKPDGFVSLRASRDPQLELWRLPVKSRPSCLSVTNSARGAIVCDKPGHAVLINPDSLSHPTEVPAGAPTSPMLLSPNGQYLVYFDLATREPVGWDVVNRRQLFRFSDLPVPASPSTIAADNIHFALGFQNGAVAIIDLREGKIVSTFPAHRGFCYACDFSPDARFLATAGFDGLVKLWDTRDSRQIAEFHSSADAYWSVALSPDGRRVAAGTGESAVVLWDVVSRQEVGSFPIGDTFGPAEGRLCFTPDGQALVFAGANRWRVWQAPNPNVNRAMSILPAHVP